VQGFNHDSNAHQVLVLFLKELAAELLQTATG